MKFEIEGKKYVLREGSSQVELKTVNVKQLDKLLPSSLECSLVQICSLQLMDDMKPHCFINGISLINEGRVLETINELLQKYDYLFLEPINLSPHRKHDHRISLKEWVGLVTIRPYKHSTL